MRTSLILALLGIAVAFLGADGVVAAQGLSMQSSSAAGVTVKATPRALPGKAWEFAIVLESHSQELNDDLLNTASLRAGKKAVAAAGWQGDPPGGHHRKGVLRFSATEAGVPEIELRITRVGEPRPRSFRWQLVE